MPELHYHTATPLLLEILKKCMGVPLFDPFRLVGGTALSLQRGHRRSVDLDLFTDAPYETIDFKKIENWFRDIFPYVQSDDFLPVKMGKPFFIGKSQTNCIKLDLFYTEAFIENIYVVDGIRLAGIREIIAMKMDVIMRNGRKKDFWDIHELMEDYSLEEMLDLHEKRYPYSHDRKLIIRKLTDFQLADDDFEPICLKGKHWELIKLDLIEALRA
ncbi:MAG: nucleotidyl transferase AbiEii/AbiGii toxin family protein [Bacteroidales bacterium]|nr:nucleotidyl transferase AbiEii/AbiGii toxin family protein [Bacteroidales bacterium]